MAADNSREHTFVRLLGAVSDVVGIEGGVVDDPAGDRGQRRPRLPRCTPTGMMSMPVCKTGATGTRPSAMAAVAGEIGARRVNQTEATIVSRIFQDYAAGASPRVIARRLNAEGVPGPHGRQWRDTAVRDHIARGTGVLNDDLYVGRLVWNRQHY